jgi:DNA repair protein RadC
VGLFNLTIMTNELTELKLSYHPGKIVGPKVISSSSAFDILLPLYDQGLLELQEMFIVLFLNRAHKVKGWYRLSTGGITGTVADPRLILGMALKSATCSLVISHNHPSGNLEPSSADKQLTDKLLSAGKFMDITILDHVIVTANGYYSFADEGLI